MLGPPSFDSTLNLGDLVGAPMCVFNVCSLNNTSPQKAHSRFHIFAWSLGNTLSLGAGVGGVVDGAAVGDVMVLVVWLVVWVMVMVLVRF